MLAVSVADSGNGTDLRADLTASLDSRFAALRADIANDLRTELRLIDACFFQDRNTVLGDAAGAARFVDFANRKMDAVGNLLLDVRRRVRLIGLQQSLRHGR
ncbi:hypothetical protein HK405_005684 [Cladochytrium tenue]|nr:hypothetical protein HK405_005684 [Cladochytrium tenue]